MPHGVTASTWDFGSHNSGSNPDAVTKFRVNVDRTGICFYKDTYAKFDIDFINSELIHWNLPTFPLTQFRCSMILFKNILMPHTYKQHYSLIACCNYFNLEYKDNHFHSALFDAFMTARMVLSLYDYISYLDNAGIEIIQKKKKETNDSSSTTSVTKNENEITDEDINELLRYF